jgi:hypothetical protein
MKNSALQNNSELEPIIETNQKLTKYGMYLVVCTSVFILCDKLKDAIRVIQLVKETKFPDVICQANIKKLHGLVLLLQKQYKEAYEELDKAKNMFQKLSLKANLGVAHCQAVQSFILYTKLSDQTEFLKS